MGGRRDGSGSPAASSQRSASAGHQDGHWHWVSSSAVGWDGMMMMGWGWDGVKWAAAEFGWWPGAQTSINNQPSFDRALLDAHDTSLHLLMNDATPSSPSVPYRYYITTAWCCATCRSSRAIPIRIALSSPVHSNVQTLSEPGRSLLHDTSNHEVYCRARATVAAKRTSLTEPRPSAQRSTTTSTRDYLHWPRKSIRHQAPSVPLPQHARARGISILEHHMAPTFTAAQSSPAAAGVSSNSSKRQ